MQLNKQTVYVPTKDKGDDFYAVLEDFEFKTNVLQVNSVYVLTPEELLELKKKWAGEAFSAGYKWANEDSYCVERGAKPDPSIPDKTTYINSLSIE